MAPIKFEDHIREQLQEREIQPSKDAWEKLNLQKVEPSKKHRNATWYAVAASIIGVIVVSSLIFRSQTTSVKNTNITKENKVLPIKIEGEIILEKTVEKAIVSEEIIKNEKTKEVSLNNVKTAKTKTINTAITEVDTSKSEIKTTEIAVENIPIIKPESTTKSEEDLFEQSKINEVVAQVQALEKENNSVTPDEIDALLQKAQNEIYSKNLISNSKKVDATALLNMVETELETTFREKVFDALGDRFEKVRTAVVERNN